MGLFRRLFSFRSKKSKKRSPTPDRLVQPPQTPTIDDERRRKLEEEEHEAAVGRLLRSSSSRYAVVKEIDYSNLPPLPHPINDVLANCNNMPKVHVPSLRPSPSTASLASSNCSRHSTFSVTVHDRQRHAATEFPNANGEFGEDLKTPIQHRSKHVAKQGGGHQLGLHSDPSVASLIELYDEQGRLPEEAFSNSPPEIHGRSQKKRGGSTLRELLGGSDSLGSSGNSNVESDISWAERFLGEADSESSSYGPHTPSTCTHSTNGVMENPKAHELTFSTDFSTSITDDPAITSMEVELSVGSEISSMVNPIIKDTAPYTNMDAATPQRASQVFSFITERNTIRDDRFPSRIPFSSSPDMSRSRRRRRIPENDQTSGQCTPRPRAPRRPPVHDEDELELSEPGHRKVRVLVTGPTKIMVTAPTPGTKQHTPSRIPIQAPRRLPNKRKAPSTHRSPVLSQRMNSGDGSLSSRGSARSRESSVNNTRRKPQSRRIASHSSCTSTAPHCTDADAIATAYALDHLARSKTFPKRGSGDKENQQLERNLTAKMELPSTPVRSHTTGRTPLFRKVMTPDLFRPPVTVSIAPEHLGPTGNSSSELSPLGKQMMFDARKQRMRFKEGTEKERRVGRRSTAVAGTVSPF